jgi:catechol 2,3-dioxygenase-like lactoylglutathione lyase family enzyme
MLDRYLVVVTIPVTDLERSRRFYGQTLGLRLLWESTMSARYAAGAGSELSIFRRAPTPTNHTLAHFEVDDIETVVRELKARGVTFEEYDEPRTIDGIAQLGPTRGAWFKDPDGHILGLREG